MADATVRLREAEVDQERARLLPSFTARGVYSRNQYPVSVSFPGGGGNLTITPENQWDAFLVLDVPIINLSQFARFDAQKTQQKLAEASVELTRRQLHEQVVRSYYTVAAVYQVGRSAQRSLEVAEQNLQVVKDRVAAGVAPDVDLSRATANVERAKRDIADAELSRVIAVRTLETLSRVTPEAPQTFPEDGLEEETPLPNWLEQGKKNLPELKVAEMQLALAEDSVDAARFAYLPSLSAQAQERITNATGFVGKAATYTLSATLTFHFDLGLPAQQSRAEAAADQSRASAEKTRRSTEDVIVEAFHRVKANIAKARSARAQFAAIAEAARLTEERYGIGAATQLDVTQAQREAFDADIAKIQADLELVQSRAILRLASGDPDFAKNSSSTHAL